MRKKNWKYTFMTLLLLSWILSAKGQNAEEPDERYRPKISGLVKAKWEYCFDDNTNRFDIRNVRLKVAGALNPLVDYGMQVNYTTPGKLSVLDGYIRLTPRENLTLWVGQFIVRFSENYVISQYRNMFANRSFVAKFVNPEARDIGMQLDYKITGTPLTAHLGVYNGNGISNPQWQKSPFVLSRLVYGTMEGFRAGVKYYGGKTVGGDRVANYGFDLRYAGKRYAVETEYVVKDSVNTGAYLSAAYLQGSYRFPVNGQAVKYLLPTLRGDAMGYSLFDRGFAVSRLTAGLNIGLDVDYMDAELRFNYECFANKNEPGLREDSHYSAYFERADKGMFDKFTIELFIKF